MKEGKGGKQMTGVTGRKARKVPGYWARVSDYLTDPIMPVRGIEWLWELPRALWISARNRKDYIEWNRLLDEVIEADKWRQ